MEKKKICFCNSLMFFGGGENFYYKLGKYLSENGYEVFYILNKESVLYKLLEKDKWANLFNLNARHTSYFNIFTHVKVYNFLKKNKIKKIILNTSRDWKAVGIASKLSGVNKIILTYGVSNPIGKSLSRKFFLNNIITDIVVKSEETKKVILDNDYKEIHKKLKCINNGIDLSEYDNYEFNKSYEKKYEEIVLGFTGRLEEDKGILYLLEMADYLKQKNIRFKLLIAGTGSMEVEFKQKVKEFGIEKEVVFLGFLKNIKSFLESIDVFVFPSLTEGFSNSVIEAMSSSKPVLAFNTSSLPEQVIDGETGYLVETKNSKQLALKVIDLSKDENLIKKIGKNGRKRVEKNFQMDIIAKQYVKLIEENEE